MNRINIELILKYVLTGIVAISFILPATGCAIFKREKKSEIEPAEVSKKESNAFETERNQQSELSDYVASAGRADPNKKKKATRGETFMLSSKAKEIYENTER